MGTPKKKTTTAKPAAKSTPKPKGQVVASLQVATSADYIETDNSRLVRIDSLVDIDIRPSGDQFEVYGVRDALYGEVIICRGDMEACQKARERIAKELVHSALQFGA